MNIRFATERDVSRIMFFIEELAEYEKMSNDVVATEDMLRKEIFEKKNAEVIFALDENGHEVGFALFFTTFSTFLGRAGIHLEDLYVLPEARGNGHGKALLKYLAGLCIEREFGRLEWTCLNWNTPSLDFYRALGAKTMDEWTSLRVSGESLLKLAENS